MKTYLRNREIELADVQNAYALWSKSKSGHKNAGVVMDRYGSSDDLVCEVFDEMKSRNLEFREIRYYERIEPTNGKVRLIGVQSVKQQVCDYLVISMLQPMLDARLGYYQCASVPGKGQVFAKNALRKWYDEGGYFLKMDVRKCYPSVDQEVLMRFLRKHVGSSDIVYVCESILSTYGSGLNIGSYFSQYMANLVLSIAYHHVETLCKTKRGKKKRLVTHQLWYMDDLVMFSMDKRDLAMAAREVERFMLEELHLHMKPWKTCRCFNDPLDMVGYRFLHGTVKLRKSTFKRARRAFSRMEKKPGVERAYRVISYWGFLKQTDGAFCSMHGRTFRESRLIVSEHGRSPHACKQRDGA